MVHDAVKDYCVEPPRVHVLPVYPDEREHEPEVTCWCEPDLSYRDPDTNGEVWTHRRVQ
jgi:hypothetical protein